MAINRRKFLKTAQLASLGALIQPGAIRQLFQTNNSKNVKKATLGSSAVIKVIGVGGGGGYAVSTMLKEGIAGVELIVADTDAKELEFSPVRNKLQLTTPPLTRGSRSWDYLDAYVVSQEDLEAIRNLLLGSDIVFIAANYEGNTGRIMAPSIATIAKELGVLTIGVLTKSYCQCRYDDYGDYIASLNKAAYKADAENYDVIITIPNKGEDLRVGGLSPESKYSYLATDGMVATNFPFRKPNEFQCIAVKSISEMITVDGLIGSDFEDVKSALLLGEGRAAMGVGIGIGKNKAREAAFGACHSELITKSTIKRVKSILINITGGSDMSLHEIDDAVSAIAKYANSNARIIFCVSVKEDMKDTMEFTLIATNPQFI